jgi:hypothetical protein
LALASAVALAVVVVGAGPGAQAVPVDDGGGGGGGDGGGDGGGGGDPCSGVTASFTLSSSTIALSEWVLAQWSVQRPTGCYGNTSMLTGPGTSGQVSGVGGSVWLQPPDAGTFTYEVTAFTPGGGLLVGQQTLTVRPIPPMVPIATARNTDGRLTMMYTNGTQGVVGLGTQRSPGNGFNVIGPPAPVRGLAAETNADGRVQYVGLDDHGRVYTSAQISAGSYERSAWAQLDGNLQSVAVARNADGRLEMFGVHPNGSVWHRAQPAANSTSWTGWSQLDGTLTQIAAETNADGRVELVGVQENGLIWQRLQAAPNSGSWSPWSNLDGGLTWVATARNADGRLEIVGTNSAGQLWVRRQTTPGATTWGGWTLVPGRATGAVAVEANADGRIEVLTVDAASGEPLHRAQRAPNGTDWSDWTVLDKRAVLHPYADACLNNADCFIADANGDGAADLITFARDGAAAVSVSLNNTPVLSDFGAPQTWATSMCPAGQVCAVADVNGDRREDVVAFTVAGAGAGAGAGTARVALSSGSAFTSASTWSTDACRDQDTCLLADMNNDNRADLVAFSRNPATTVGDGDAWVSPSTGTSFGQRQPWSHSICTGDQTCAVADVNGDGFADAIALAATGTDKGRAWAALGTSAGLGATTLWSTDTRCVDDTVCVVADFDGDVKADILAKSPGDTADNKIWVSLSTGGGFGAPTTKDSVSDGGLRTRPRQPSCGELRAQWIYLRGVARYLMKLYKLTGNEIFHRMAMEYYEKAIDVKQSMTDAGCPTS